MKKIKKAILGSPKTSILGFATALLTVLKYYNALSIDEYLMWLGVIGTILGLAAKDGDKPANQNFVEKPPTGGDRPPSSPTNP